MVPLQALMEMAPLAFASSGEANFATGPRAARCGRMRLSMSRKRAVSIASAPPSSIGARLWLIVSLRRHGFACPPRTRCAPYPAR
jgi:hypothetical protein